MEIKFIPKSDFVIYQERQLGGRCTVVALKINDFACNKKELEAIEKFNKENF